jgi:heme a synthase
MIRRLSLIALLLTALVVVFGAYVRLSDAGLGCPDWPGCYGAVSPHHAADEIQAAQAAQPLGPVSMPKAWKEMIHRYLASTLGLFILTIALLAWRRRARGGATAIGLPLAIVAVVGVQGLLGKWTVTLLLKPAIVSLHLLGGLSVFALLLCLHLRERRAVLHEATPGLVTAARLGLILLIAQIVLGGWVSTNYAALACTDFPTCQSTWVPQMHFGEAFHVFRELGMTSDGGYLSLAALTAIHWTHRLGAVVVGIYLFLFAFSLARHLETRRQAIALFAATCAQIALGIANVVLHLPLATAVAHNAGALALVAVLVAINYRLRRPAPYRHRERRLHESLAA